MTVRIPNPSADSMLDFKHLAFLSTTGGYLRIFWWADLRTVVAYKSTNETWWRISNDETIRDSLWTLCCGVLETCDDLKARDMRYSEGQTQEPRPFDDEMLRQFFDCEWTDFACDGIVIHGTIEMYVDPPEAPTSPPGQSVLTDTDRPDVNRRRTRYT